MFLLLFVVLSVTARACSFESAPASDLQWMFDVPQGDWCGSDCFTSIPIPPAGASVVLLGDTFVGTMNGTLRVVRNMPRNAVALMPIGNESRIRWFIRESDPPFSKSIGFFTPNNSSEWYWPLSGVYAKGGLFLFTLLVHETGGGPGLSFEVLKTVVLHVPNPLDDPFSWKVIATDVPFTSSKLQWAVATSYDERDGVVFILGQSSNTDAVLSRIAVSDLSQDRLDRLEVFNSDRKFVPVAEGVKLMRVFGNSVSETTLTWSPLMKLWYVLIIPPFSNKVAIRTSPQLTGPWSPEKEIYRIPDVFVTSGNFAYAPKSHPELAVASNEIIWTFMSNSMVSISPPAPIYVPQVMRTLIK